MGLVKMPLHLPPYHSDEPWQVTRKRADFRTMLAQFSRGRGFRQFPNSRASVMPDHVRRFRRQWPGGKNGAEVGVKAGVRRER